MKFAAVFALALVGCVAARTLESDNSTVSVGQEDGQLQSLVAFPVDFDAGKNKSRNYDDNDQFSQFALIPDASEETRYLSEQNKIFESYCVESRDTVRMFMDNMGNEIASRVFNIMFNSVGEIGAEALKASNEALQEGAKKVAASGSATVNSWLNKKNAQPKTGAEIEENLAEGEKQIEEGKAGGIWAAIVSAGKYLVQTIFKAVATEASVRIALLKSEFATENIPTHVTDACNALSFKLKTALEVKLRKYAAAVKAEDDSGKFTEVLKATRIENVGCVTTGRIVKAAALCDCLRIAGPSLYPLMGL